VAAVPAYAGIPITDREYSSSFGVYSAHRRAGLSHTDDEWRRIAQGPDTLIFLMGKTRCDLVVAKLAEFGRPASTPVAMIFDGTTPQQQTVVGTLATIVSQTQAMDVPGPGLIVVGNVVNARKHMDWFETRTAKQAADGRSKCPAE
jgi:siroheme synthase